MFLLSRFFPTNSIKLEDADSSLDTFDKFLSHKLETTTMSTRTPVKRVSQSVYPTLLSDMGPTDKLLMSSAYPSPSLTPDPRRRAVQTDDDPFSTTMPISYVSQKKNKMVVAPISPPTTPLRSRERSGTSRSRATSAGSSSTSSQTTQETPSSSQLIPRRSSRIQGSATAVKQEPETTFLTPPTTPLKNPRKSRTSTREIKASPTDVESRANIVNTRRPSHAPAPNSSAVIKLDDLEFDTPEYVVSGPPSEPPALFLQGSVGIFRNAETLQYFQALDLHLLLKRERGEPVCGTNVINNVGYVLAYDMGCGKTVMSIALIVINPPPANFGGARATLVIVPSQGIMDHWLGELKIFAPHLKACRYGSISDDLRQDADIVLCTYIQVQRQFSALKQNRDAKCPLFHFMWYRIITDEAHIFRNPSSQTANGILTLQKKHGLCLTGTPAQNTFVDYYPLFKFLGVKHENIDDIDAYYSKVYGKKQRAPPSPSANRLLNTLKKSFLIVREKTNPVTGVKLVDIPERFDHIIDVDLTPHERAVHDHVKELPKCPFARFTHMRQACDHPALVSQFVSREKLYGNNLQEARTFSTDGIFKLEYLSSKMRSMSEILRKRPLGEKTIVFTHFTSLFHGITNALRKEGISWARYAGDMRAKDREQALKQIKEDDSCTVIIISILAGGTGLNITSCSSVILLDPWWNPYVEEQAISRVHRFGQVKTVNVYHLVAVDSVEVYIMETQARKRSLIEFEGNYDNAIFEDTGIDRFDEKEFQDWLVKQMDEDKPLADATWRVMYDNQ